MYYTIRVNGVIAAKCENTSVAAGIVSMYQGEKEVKVINNIFKRIAFNNQRKHWSYGHIVDSIRAKDDQFVADYNRKNELWKSK